MNDKCQYRVVSLDGFGTEWRTDCAHLLYVEAPNSIGLSFAPLPTANGAIYCRWCSKPIDLVNHAP